MNFQWMFENVVEREIWSRTKSWKCRAGSDSSIKSCFDCKRIKGAIYNKNRRFKALKKIVLLNWSRIEMLQLFNQLFCHALKFFSNPIYSASNLIVINSTQMQFVARHIFKFSNSLRCEPSKRALNLRIRCQKHEMASLLIDWVCYSLEIFSSIKRKGIIYPSCSSTCDYFKR